MEWWGGVDFLLGWRHGIRTPALLTTSPNGTAQANAGVLPNATVVYPPQPFGEEARPGGRASLGVWLDPCHCWGLEGRFFMLADQVTTFTLASTGDPILARPFVNGALNARGSRLLAFPGLTDNGGLTVTTESQLSGGDALLHRAISRWDDSDLELLVGYQFTRLDETLVIQDLSTDDDPANLIADGTTDRITDRFATRNQYHAASIGSKFLWNRGPVRWEILGKVGLGNNRQTVTISGTEVVTVPAGAANTTQTGLLAQGTNLGTFTQDKFCAAPELDVRCVYQVSDRVNVSAGYNFLYLTSVAQPGNQIDVDLRVPTNRFRIRDSEFWMHAFQFGVSVTF